MRVFSRWALRSICTFRMALCLAVWRERPVHLLPARGGEFQRTTPRPAAHQKAHRPMSDKQPPVERESFEEALDRLEQITRALEGGDIELDQSLALYEEGIRLVRLAEDVIREAEIRIERLHEDGSTSRINVGERQG